MNLGDRAYGLVKAFVNREWERVVGPDVDREAQREYYQSWKNNPAQQSKLVDKSLPHVQDSPSPDPQFDGKERACRILGVKAEAEIAEIQKAYEALMLRCESTRFVAGSEEAFQASQIRGRVLEAYRILTEGLDVTERRFRSLEL